MVNIDELRRNNWVHVYDLSLKPSSRYAQVAGIKPDGTIFIKNDDGFLKIKESATCVISAIPLTDELLEVCGFERDDENNLRKDIELVFIDGSMNFHYNGEYLDNIGWISSLHRLQNFHYEYYNEELEINFDGS